MKCMKGESWIFKMTKIFDLNIDLHCYNHSLEIIEQIKNKRETIYIVAKDRDNNNYLLKILIKKMYVEKIGKNWHTNIPIYHSLIECDCFEAIQDD